MLLYRNFIKTVKKIVIWFLLSLLAILVAGYIALQLPATQTFIIQKIVTAASEHIDGEVNIGRVHYIFFNKIILQDISIVSKEQSEHLDSLRENFNHSDTLLSCRKLSVSIHGADLFKQNIRLKRIKLNDGVFNLQNEGGNNTNLSRIFKIDKNKVKDTTKRGFPINLLAERLKIDNFRFTLNNPDKYIYKGDSIINFANLRVSDINIDIDRVRIERDTIFGTIRKIEGRDQSGFRLAKLSGNVEVSAKEARIKNLQLADSYTKVNARYFFMQYKSAKDLSNFVNLVRLGIDLNETYFSFKTIGRIAPKMSKSTLGLFISGKVEGPVRDLRSNRLEVKSESGQTFMELNCKLTGLPDIYQTMSSVDIKNCYTTSEDITRIISSLNGVPIEGFLKRLSPNIQYNFKGGLMGLPHDFVAHGTISSDIGSIKLDLLLKNDDIKNGFVIQGNAQSYDFNVGSLIANDNLGEVSMRTSLSALFSKSNGPSISIDSLRVSKLGFNKYDYSNIFAIGKYDKQIFDGRIICHDPNLDFIFHGLLSFSKTESNKYNFYADIPYANLAALNIDNRDSVSILKTRTIANFTSTSNNDIVGNISVQNTTYTNSKGNFNIGTIKLNSHAANNDYSSTITAPFINATYNGTAPFTSFIEKAKALAIQENISNFINKESITNSNDLQDIIDKKDEYSLSITTLKTASVCELLLPGLYLQDNTRIQAKIDTCNTMDVRVLSGRVAVNQNYLKNLDIDINNRDSMLNINMFSENIRLAGMRLDSSALSIKGRNNVLDARFGFKNDSTEDNRANLESSIVFNPLGVSVQIKENSFITLKGEKWSVMPNSLSFADSSITINGFTLQNKEQHLTAGGILNGKERDSLDIGLENFDIDIFNLFLNRPFDVKGLFSGSANISTHSGNTNIFLDITGDSVSVYKNPVGIMRILSRWDDPLERFKVLISTKLNGKSNLMVTGYYKPKENYINLDGELDDLSVCYFEPFLSSLISKTKGTLSGDLSLKGKLNQLKLEGDNCEFKDFGFIVNYTQVPYTLNGPVSLDEKGIYAKNLVITDQFGNKGRVMGGLKYNYFRNPVLDTRLEFLNLQCLETNENQNEAFYGNAFATGFMNIKGPFNNIALDINVTPSENTALHIPLSSSSTATQTNLLTFKEPEHAVIEDPYEIIMQSHQKEKKSASQMQVNLRANMNTNAEMFIEINKSLGDIIKANGNGNVSLDINPSKDVFDIFGDYNINQGSYKFVMPGFGFAAKDFIIQPGGTIHFNGDISNTTINLTATYKTKAAINTLIADTSAVSTRRNVNCEIIMSGNLMNPELAFNIDIPDLDPTTKVRVESALNTEGKIQKQFAALLISGGFLPDEQGGITNNSTILYSNVSELLSNQINNIFQQLGIPLDLGFNYQPGEKGTTDIFDVAVSTQLFNNRLLINGNIGNDPYASSNNKSVIGNVDVEYKLDKSGRLRMSVFSHAADQYSNYLDDSQRSGIGISYQQEFNRLSDIFRRKSKEQKEFEKRMKEREKAERKEEREERKRKSLLEFKSTDQPL